MTNKSSLSAIIFQIHQLDTVGYTTLSTSAYSRLFQSIDKSVATELVFQTPQELIISSSDVMGLARALISVLTITKKKIKCHVLSLEMLNKDQDVDSYDDLCESIHLALGNQEVRNPWCITIAISKPPIFQESVFLKRRLIPICDQKKIGLILLSDDPDFKPLIICKGTLPPISKLPRLQAPPKDAEQNLSSEEISNLFQIVFGHFQVQYDNKISHVSNIASVKKLAQNTVFLKQLSRDLTELLDTDNFKIFHYGISAGGMDELAFNLVQGDADRLGEWDKIKKNETFALLYDFISPVYDIHENIRKLKKYDPKKIIVAGIANCKDAPTFEDIPKLFYLKTNFESCFNHDKTCRFCQNDVPLVEGEYFDSLVRNIYEFEPFTFWEFIAQDKRFYEVGHWRSDRTPNHYYFRIIAEPIFKQYGLGISLRLRNIFERENIIPSWVKKIVCTEGEESFTLSLNLAEVLGLSPDDVVRIPRRYISSIAGRQLGKELLGFMNSTYDEKTIRHQNVIIVDQAAHHFKTLSALKCICEYYDCTILAFAVFIDRVGSAFSLGEYLPDSHYYSLYSWPMPPRRAHECPCVER